MGSADPPGKIDEKLKSENMQKEHSFLRLSLCYILRAIRAGRCRERRYADHVFIQIYFRMHHFVDKFSKFCFASGGKGALTPLTKILRSWSETIGECVDLTEYSSHCSRKRVQQPQERKKSCFWSLEKNAKDRIKTYAQFQRPLNHSGL